MRLQFIGILTITLASVVPAFAQDRETKVRNDRAKFETSAEWIYNDLPKGIATAKETGKPLLVVFRCIPCEACAQLDEQVVERDPGIRGLLDQFVCVRIVHANGMDLSLFQFDYDQSWAAFLMNADSTIYGRYGTRSHQTESDNDVSLEGFGKALSGALALHTRFTEIKDKLAAKRGPKSSVQAPEDFASLKGKYGSKLNYEGKVVQSCIHCHQVGEALRAVSRSQNQPIPEKVLYPYPNPKILGLILDPKAKAKVSQVVAGSSGAKDGFLAGDEIVELEGQPILSIADVQWVLHHTGPTARLKAKVTRAGKTIDVPVTLAEGWRQQDDISWRATSWALRRMALGGLRLESLPDEARSAAKIPKDQLALRVQHVGQYNEHAAAKNAGFQKEDILVAVDNQTTPLTESALMAQLLQSHKSGERIPVTVLRGGKRIDLKLPQQQ